MFHEKTQLDIIIGHQPPAFPVATSVRGQRSGRRPGTDSAGRTAPHQRQRAQIFAKAYLEFEKIRSEYGPKIGTAPTPQEKGAAEQEAVLQFGKALEREGMTMQQYSALYQIVSADQQLRERVLRLIEEERARS
jgi:hypothetical protein